MKTTLKFSGIASAIFTILGATLKVFHLPGASVCILLGGILFSLVFLPLMIVLKFKDEEKKTDKIVLSFGFLIAMFIFTGVLFKLMHWPFATILMISGTATFIFAYVPIYFATRVKRPELRFNTTINSVLMMACGGLLFALFDLGYSKKMTDRDLAIHNLKKSSEKVLKMTESDSSKGLILEMKRDIKNLEEQFK